MSVNAFSRILSGYKWVLLVQVETKDIDSKDKGKGRINQTMLKEYREIHRPFKLKLLKVVEAVESTAFHKRMRLVAGLLGGSCVLCERCADDKSSQATDNSFSSYG